MKTKTLAQAQPGITVDMATLMGFEHRQGKPLSASQKASKYKRRGDFRSLFKGKGMAFSEVRQYQAGDDVRTIDWRVTARRGGQPHTKIFEEERERPVYIVVDQRSHLFFGTQRCFKSVLGCEIAALLAWQALAVGDRTSYLVFGDQQHHQHRPQAGKRGVLGCLQALVEANQALLKNHEQIKIGQAKRPDPTKRGPDTLKMLETISHLAKPGSYVVLVSDFAGLYDINEPDRALAAQHALRTLSEHTHTYGIYLYDLLETSLPPIDRLDFTDGDRAYSLQARNQRTREKYQTQFLYQLAGLQKLFKRSGLPLLLRGTHQVTDQTLVSTLHQPKWRLADIKGSEQIIQQGMGALA